MFEKRERSRNNDVTIRKDLDRLKERAGWVLVGGASRRMGADKALIELDGQPLALRVAAGLAGVCGSVALVGDPARYASLGLPVVADEFPGDGPLAGIEAALRTTSAEWNLVLACDMPALEPGIFERLFAAGGDCAIPQYEDGRLEPLCAVYHRRCHGAVRAALMEGIRKVTLALRTRQAGHAAITIRYVRMANDASFANLNTQEDLRKYTNG